MTSSDGLPVIPLSPIAKSTIICSNAQSQATETYNKAKQASPPVSVDVLRRLLENVLVERNSLEALVRKKQSVEAATPLYWDSDTLARQIVIVNSQLFKAAMIDKRGLSQVDQRQTGLDRLTDFHKYLTHSMAHQLIYWGELSKPNSTAPVVVPPVHHKDNLVAHMVRVAYLLIHAYRDFSGFAAIMTALSLPEVGRIKRLWQGCSSRTKEMYRDLVQIISPANDYQAYRQFLRNKLELFVHIHNHANADIGMMIAIPWIQPHLASIQSIVTIYTAGDNEDQKALGDIVLSAPGAHKMDIEMSILVLCQRNSTLSDNLLLEEIMSDKKKKPRPSSIAAVSKPIHLDCLRTAVIPTANLNHLAPGDQLAHHWLLSRVYLTRDQLIDESKEVEPWRKGEEEISYEKDIIIQKPISLPLIELPKINTSNDGNKSGDEPTSHEVTPEKEAKEHDKGTSIASTSASKQISQLSPSAPEFIPSTTKPSSENKYPNDDGDSEKWDGYPSPNEDEEEVWKGYPGPNTDSPRRGSSQSETSEEWKGYQATKMEADWQRESAMKVHEHEWQGYTLETYNEDELDSSTMLHGKFL